MTHVLTLQSEVPFGQAVHALLYLNDIHLNNLPIHDQIERHYLAWETVRKELNPFFQEGTGFEGYLVGRCSTPEEALEAVLAINQHMLDAIARLYRFQYQFRSHLMKTLTREISDTEAIHTWSAYLGAELGKLRAQIANNLDAKTFQLQTYQMIGPLPPMIYHELGDDVTQTYTVAAENAPRPGKLSISLPTLKPSQQDAWLVAENIGQFGHPLVRKLLDSAQPDSLLHH